MKSATMPWFKKRTLTLSLALASVLALPTMDAAHADGFTNVYAFGDSLSDNGNLSAATNSATTTKLLWEQILAGRFGITMTPAWNYSNPTAPVANSTGNIFALGGGTTADQTNSNGVVIKGTGSQIDALISRSGGKLDSKALYLVWIGGNDIGNAWGAWLQGGASAAGVSSTTTALAAAAGRVAQQVATLQAAGAKTIMVMNAPDVSVTPYVRDVAEGAAIQVSGGPTNTAAISSTKASLLSVANTFASAYNTALATAMTGKNVLYIDANALLGSLLANPASYGLDPKKLTSATTNYLLQGTSATAVGTLCPTAFSATAQCTNTPNTGFIYSNNFHPTDTVHGIFSDLVYQTLSSIGASNKGASISNLALVVPLGRSGAEWRTIDNRTRNFQNFGYSGKGARIFVAGDYADANAEAPDGSKAGSGSTLTGTVGMETAIGPNTLFGGTLGVENADLDIVNNAGRLQYREIMASLFVSHKIDNWYVNGLASVGSLTFDTSRNVVLGLGSSNEKARFDGSHYGVKGQLGYQIRSGSMIHGPFVGVDYETAKVDPFSEGGSQYAISVQGQTIKQAHYRVGYEVAGETTWGSAAVRPWLVASYDHQYLEDERTVIAGLAASGAMLASTNRNQTGGFSRLGAGFSTKLSGGSDLSIGLSTSFNNPGGDDTAVNVVWNMAM